MDNYLFDVNLYMRSSTSYDLILTSKVLNTYKLELFIHHVGQTCVKVLQPISIEFSA